MRVKDNHLPCWMRMNSSNSAIAEVIEFEERMVILAKRLTNLYPVDEIRLTS